MRTIFALAFGLAALLAAPAPAEAQEYRVIVHASNGTTQLTRDDLQRVFLKKLTTWQDGSAVVPVDQSARSAVRAQFSQQVLGRDVGTMKNYWQQSLFSGRGVPPMEQPSDAQVIAFVASNPGAIGYVSSSASLPDKVKTVAIAR